MASRKMLKKVLSHMDTECLREILLSFVIQDRSDKDIRLVLDILIVKERLEVSRKSMELPLLDVILLTKPVITTGVKKVSTETNKESTKKESPTVKERVTLTKDINSVYGE